MLCSSLTTLFLNDSRRQQREKMEFSVWPSSPEVSPSRERSNSPDTKRKHRSAKSDSSDESKSPSRSDDSEDSGSEEDYRRSRRRHKSSSKKRKHSSKHKHKHKRSRKHRSSRKERRYSDDSDTSSTEESEREMGSRKSKKNGKPEETARQNLEKVVAKDSEGQDGLWVEKQVELPEDASVVGPIPLPVSEIKMDERSYGGALRPGEGSAIAQYVQQGKRIPRRGEIGLTGEEIEKYENVGYVMSGSRHHRMNAVRIRKENQVISAEEKRALLQYHAEERAKKENKIITDFRELLSERLKK
ncbi:uncharacterized protein VTP21DRAFT_8492 [Calcarisporiella thermophila]|uniref:uncharacterized protein n=1 Tax=Calcarisporiella thermophila TaxID=911321 RepID=UPI0037420E62